MQKASWRAWVVRCVALTAVALSLVAPVTLAQTPSASYSYHLYLPNISGLPEDYCEPIPEETYYAIPVAGLSPDPGVPAASHPDLNLALRGYTENTTAARSLISVGGAFDANAPRLQSIFAGSPYPSISHTYRVYQWDGGWPGVYGVYPITSPDVTLIGLASSVGQKVYVPYRGPEIFWDTVSGRHYDAMVLYAAHDRITIKYTRDDSVISGYTVHIEGICVEPRLVALYNQLEAAGRSSLPGLMYGQAIGRSSGTEVGLAIRDTGAFMDPRVQKDWWQGVSSSSDLELPVLDFSGQAWYDDQQQRLTQTP